MMILLKPKLDLVTCPSSAQILSGLPVLLEKSQSHQNTRPCKTS